jgi:AmmeMemoRadiSam system protein A
MNPLVSLAKQAVENYIKEGKVVEPSVDLPKEFLTRKAGVFMTIKKNGKLRGCIGTYLPTRNNIAEEIIHNAITVATEDYRFGPIQSAELTHLSYEVSILSEPELVKDEINLNPKKFGIIVKSQGFSSPDDVIFNPAPKLYQKTGLLLPDLEGIDTVDKQISIACQKCGINPKTEKFSIYKFTVEKYQ